MCQRAIQTRKKRDPIVLRVSTYIDTHTSVWPPSCGSGARARRQDTQQIRTIADCFIISLSPNRLITPGCFGGLPLRLSKQPYKDNPPSTVKKKQKG